MAHASGVYDTFVELWSGQSSGGGHIRPLLAPARYKGAYGGRGSGKSHFFGELMVARCLTPGTRAVCIRETQKSLAQSSKRMIEDKKQVSNFWGTKQQLVSYSVDVDPTVDSFDWM